MNKIELFEKELIKEMLVQRQLTIHQADLSSDINVFELGDISEFVFNFGDYDVYSLPLLIKCFNEQMSENFKEFLLNEVNGWEIVEKYLEQACDGWRVVINYAKKYFSVHQEETQEGVVYVVDLGDGTIVKLVQPSYQYYIIPFEEVVKA